MGIKRTHGNSSDQLMRSAWGKRSRLKERKSDTTFRLNKKRNSRSSFWMGFCETTKHTMMNRNMNRGNVCGWKRSVES